MIGCKSNIPIIIAEHIPGIEAGENYYEFKNADNFRIYAPVKDGEFRMINCGDIQAYSN